MRGAHTVFLGMAAGVGKTFRMLGEGRAQAAAGRDVVLAYLEPHDRPETAAQAEGLELLPRLAATRVGELDLQALVARAPELALIDELAHTNAPGLRHAKRWEDVDAALQRGIDVFSTVNVQHLESLNDRLADLTGVRVRETLPDAVLARADEIVLVDLPPEALIARLRAGKVYPAERVPAALNGFFKVESLAALREVALRQVADDVQARRLVRRDLPVRVEHAATADEPQPVGERLLALVLPRPDSQRIVRRASRSAARLGAELDLLWVAPSERVPSAQQREQLDALRRLAAVFGATLLTEHGDDVVDVVRRVAGERQTTYVLLGAPGPRRGLDRLREPLVVALVRALPGVDVRLVADPTLRASGEGPRTG